MLLATTSGAEGLAESRAALGEENVVVTGDEVDLAALRAALAERGLSSVLSEGGPSLFADLVAAGVLDEVCLTVVPQLVGGDHPRIATGPDTETAAAADHPARAGRHPARTLVRRDAPTD